jgi:hypothetical protein
MESRLAPLLAGGGCSMSSRPLGERGSNAATRTGLSARYVKVEAAGFAKSGRNSQMRTPSAGSPNSSAVK